MSFVTSAVLLATIYGNFGDSQVVEIARFGNDHVGVAFCDGTAEAINSQPVETQDHYFCASPEKAKELLAK